MSHKALRDQRGIAAILEVIIVVVVLAGIGGLAYQAYQAHQASTPVANTTIKASATTPNGQVSHAANALTAEAQAEASDSSQESGAVQSVDSVSSDQTSLEGAYNENQF